MGGSGHFGLGNSNTLATVDVAGAYIVRLFLLSFVLTTKIEKYPIAFSFIVEFIMC